MIESVLLSILAIVVFLFVLYTAVKLGTFAFYRGRQLFHEQEKRNGDEKKEA